jgi:hypothetical protein
MVAKRGFELRLATTFLKYQKYILSGIPPDVV